MLTLCTALCVLLAACKHTHFVQVHSCVVQADRALEVYAVVQLAVLTAIDCLLLYS
jgi:hypothetical protein